VDTSGNVFVADTGNHRIQEFKNDGSFVTTWGTKGTGIGQFDRPSGIAVGSSGNVYVLDSGNNRVQKFQLASPCPKGTEITSGVCFITKWGSHGSANGQFNFSAGIDVDSSGNVFVADSYNNRIQKFKNDGTFLTKWGTFGNKEGQFKIPFGVAVDKSGVVFVVDVDNNRIEKFKNDGGNIRVWGSVGSGNGQFDTHLALMLIPQAMCT
jgi:DNA-binding beta-propeller fold protein YncE